VLAFVLLVLHQLGFALVNPLGFHSFLPQLRTTGIRSVRKKCRRPLRSNYGNFSTAHLPQLERTQLFTLGGGQTQLLRFHEEQEMMSPDR
jgi:hypothetical protein